MMTAGLYIGAARTPEAEAEAERLQALGYRVLWRSAPDYRVGEAELFDLLVLPESRRGVIDSDHRAAYPDMPIHLYGPRPSAPRRNRGNRTAGRAARDAALPAPDEGDAHGPV